MRCGRSRSRADPPPSPWRTSGPGCSVGGPPSWAGRSCCRCGWGRRPGCHASTERRTSSPSSPREGGMTGREQALSRVSTADGTDLAVATLGDGRPVVYVSGWLSHLQLGWELPEERAFYEALGRGGRLGRYGRARCGLSAPTARPPSLEYELEQLAAVVADLGPEPFDL